MKVKCKGKHQQHLSTRRAYRRFWREVLQKTRRGNGSTQKGVWEYKRARNTKNKNGNRRKRKKKTKLEKNCLNENRHSINRFELPNNKQGNLHKTKVSEARDNKIRGMFTLQQGEDTRPSTHRMQWNQQVMETGGEISMNPKTEVKKRYRHERSRCTGAEKRSRIYYHHDCETGNMEK